MNEESIFHGRGDRRYTAGVNYPNATHELMTEGYLRAAQRLVKTISDNAWGVDYMVYPVIFLYRHWFELRLKNIIDLGRQLVQVRESGYDTTHSLGRLWPVARDLIQKVWEGDRPSEFDLIESIISDFEKFDPYSQAFRYPITRNGENQLEGLNEINVMYFSDQMDKIAEFIDGAAMGISVYLDNRSFYGGD